MKPIYTATEVAEILDYNTAHVRRLLISGKMIGEKPRYSRMWLVRAKELRRWMKKRGVVSLSN